MVDWSFLTKHARVLVCIAHDPGVRLRDIATTLEITERSAYGIVTDLAEAGYLVKDKDGRRNRYQVQAHLPLRETIGRERTIGEVLELLVDANTPRRRLVHHHRLAQGGFAPELAPTGRRKAGMDKKRADKTSTRVTSIKATNSSSKGTARTSKQAKPTTTKPLKSRGTRKSAR